MSQKEIFFMLESMIFASLEPISAEKLHEALNQADINISLKEVKEALSGLYDIWQDGGIVLKRFGELYAFVTNEKNALMVRKMFLEKPTVLSKAQLEVLSIVAYRQPITRLDIDEIRGVDSSFAVKKLLQYKLLKILGKSEGLGKPLLYGTSKYFLEFFALNSLNDLPTLNQYELLGESEEEAAKYKEVSLKDLFLEQNDKELFLEKTKKLSEDALKSLDEALLRVSALNLE